MNVTLNPGTSRRKFAFPPQSAATSDDLSDDDDDGLIEFPARTQPFYVEDVDPALAERHHEAQKRAAKVGNTAYHVGNRARPATAQPKTATGHVGRSTSRNRQRSASTRRASVDALMEAGVKGSRKADQPPPRPPNEAMTAHLAKFPHLDGAHVCEGIFKHHVNPDGTVCHYYHHDPVWEQVCGCACGCGCVLGGSRCACFCCQIPEDTFIIPIPPTSLSDILQDAPPEAPDVLFPTSDDAAQALASSTDTSQGGSGSGSSMVQLLQSMARSGRQHIAPTWARTHPELVASAGMQDITFPRGQTFEATTSLGSNALPPSHRIMTGADRCQFSVKIVVLEHEAVAVEDAWDPAMGVFAPRKTESESKDLYDTPQVYVCGVTPVAACVPQG